MPMNMLDSIGLLYRIYDDDRFEFIGTCFAYKSSQRFITAAHCIEGIPNDSLKIMPFHNRIFQNIFDYEVHPEADIAIINLDPYLTFFQFNPFDDCIEVKGLGMDFAAFGFPEDTQGQNHGQPMPRLFKGHIQCLINYQRSTYKYKASELSIACPRGLSGGPIFSVYEPQKIIGVVTENIQATTVLYEEERLSTGEHDYHHKYIEYGVAVLFDPIKEWVEERIPQHLISTNSRNRRAD